MGATMNVLLISANREDINMLTLPMGLACVAAAKDKRRKSLKAEEISFVSASRAMTPLRLFLPFQ